MPDAITLHGSNQLSINTTDSEYVGNHTISVSAGNSSLTFTLDIIDRCNPPYYKVVNVNV